MRQPQLLSRIQHALLQTVNGYLPIPAFARDIESYVVPSRLDQKAGLYGALVLAERALATATKSGPPS